LVASSEGELSNDGELSNGETINEAPIAEPELENKYE